MERDREIKGRGEAGWERRRRRDGEVRDRASFIRTEKVHLSRVGGRGGVRQGIIKEGIYDYGHE